MQLAFTDSVAIAAQELAVEIACTAAQILEAKQLRYRVYCEERGFEAGEGGIEQDSFDASSRHILVRSRFTGEVYGTVRVALSDRKHAETEFPMEHLCQPWVFSSLPRTATGEVSRFALTRDRSGLSPAAASLMRLCLIQGVLKICDEHGLSHLCALMERTLIRLLEATSIYFVPVGPTIEHRGARRSATWTIGDGLAHVRRENPVVWSFITLDGQLCAGSSERRAARRRAA